MIFGREITAIAAVISIGLNLALTFGLQLNADQVALINALVVAGLALLVRQNVTTISAPQLPLGTKVNTPAGEPDAVVTAL